MKLIVAFWFFLFSCFWTEKTTNEILEEPSHFGVDFSTNPPNFLQVVVAESAQ